MSSGGEYWQDPRGARVWHIAGGDGALAWSLCGGWMGATRNQVEEGDTYIEGEDCRECCRKSDLVEVG